MNEAPPRWAVLWIKINIVMFFSYFLFGLISFFWPSPLAELWLYPLHLAGLALDLLILYGLYRKRPWIILLVPVFSFAMILHLVAFIFVPLSLSIAYIGPSRSFYTLMIHILSAAGAEGYSAISMAMFNAVVLVLHAANIAFFVGKRAARMFSQPA